MPSPKEMNAQAQQRLATARENLMQLAQARQMQEQAMRQRYEDETQALYDEEQARLRGQELSRQQSWHDDAAKGAAMGSSFGPWGALIGGIIGSAKGTVESIGSYTREGDNVGEAMLKTFGEVLPGVSLGRGMLGAEVVDEYGAGMLADESMAYGGQAAGQAYSKYAADQRRQSAPQMQMAMPQQQMMGGSGLAGAYGSRDETAARLAALRRENEAAVAASAEDPYVAAGLYRK